MKLYRIVATLFGIGDIPLAPGTFGSLAALPFAWFLDKAGGPWLLLAAAAIAFAVGVWACETYVRETGNPDPSECVVDELAGQWVACLVAPLTPVGYAFVFVAFRIFDIVKPWPISSAERAHGGLGVMLDDIVAGVFAAILVAAVHATGVI